jgi:hypothetical protein
MRLAGHVARTEDDKFIKILTDNPQGKRTLGKSSSTWENNFKWILGKNSWKKWIGFIWLMTEINGILL